MDLEMQNSFEINVILIEKEKESSTMLEYLKTEICLKLLLLRFNKLQPDMIF